MRLCIILIILLRCVVQASASPLFRDVESVDGFEYMNVSSMAQDEKGLLWIGTGRGLYSYDGYVIKRFLYEKSLRQYSKITHLLASGDILWVGTRNGLLTVNLKTHSFEQFHAERALKDKLKQSVRYVKKMGEAVFGVYFKGSFCVIRLDTAKRILEEVPIEGLPLEKIDHNVNVSSGHTSTFVFTSDSLYGMKCGNDKFVVDSRYSFSALLVDNERICSSRICNDYFYIRTISGIYRFSLKNGRIDVRSRKQLVFRDLGCDFPRKSTGHFEVDPYTGNLYCIHKYGIWEITSPFGPQPKPLVYSTSLNSDKVLPTASINSLYIDSFRNLWFLTQDCGILYCSLLETPFKRVNIPRNKDYYNVNDYITGVTEGNDGTIWFSTHLGGLYCYNSITHKTVDSGYREELIQGIKHTKDTDEILVALPFGLKIYDSKSRTVELIMGVGGKLLDKHVNVCAIDIDKWGNIWLGTWKEGLYCIRRGMHGYEIVRHIRAGNVSGSNIGWVLQILCDENTGELYACMDNGLLRISFDSEGELTEQKLYNSRSGSGDSLPSDFVSCIDKENDSIYWIGTSGGGVCRIAFDRSGEEGKCQIVAYTEKNGLSSDEIEQVLVGENDDIWIGSDHVSRLDMKSEQIYEYDYVNVGPMTSGICGRGVLYYMAGKSLLVFNPSLVKETNFFGKLMLTDLYVHDQRIKPLGKYNDMVILESDLNDASVIHLKHNQREFYIAFSALNFQKSNRVKYRYRLLGFEKDWRVKPIDMNKAYFSNLDYGKYRFQVQMSLDNGVTWEKESKQIAIHIHPPWWWSLWSKMFYAILSSIVLFSLFYLFLSRVKIRQELKLSNLSKLKDEENHQMRLRFFMNISHEFKTPLTLINVAIEELEKKVNFPEFDVIKRNSSHLLKLIMELVDFRKSDMGIETLVLTKSAIAEQVNAVYDEMKIWAATKNIKLDWQSDLPDSFFFDKEKMNYIIVNLLSNSIKNVQEGGKVSLCVKTGNFEQIVPEYKYSYVQASCKQKDVTCLISVCDTGVGISEGSINKIFDRYFQVKGTTDTHLGSGIGLALVKNWVLLHQGAICVSSERMVGTEIIISIPMDLHPEEGERAGSDENAFIFRTEDGWQPGELIEEESVIKDDLPLMLIVEDCDALRQQLAGHFKMKYNVMTAVNGKDAYELCTMHYPDLVISDVMMPVMDGIELCHCIRENLKIAYIPVILLTAKGELQEQIEGYESGADMYIPKPFSLKILDMNVSRLLSYKLKQIREGNSALPDKEVALRDELEQNGRFQLEREKDVEFMNKLDQFILDNLDKSDLSVLQISQAMATGKTKLYTKVKELYGISLGERIRDLRLERAAYLLRNSDMQINEIALEVGYETNSHFSKIFKRKYEMTPTEYMEM